MEPGVHHLQSFINLHNSTSKMSSPYPCCWYIHVFVYWLNGWTCVDWDGCHGLHCSEYWPCILHNTVALLYAFATTLPTPTPCWYNIVFTESAVHLREASLRSRVCLLGVSFGGGGGEPYTISMGRSICVQSSTMTILVHPSKLNLDGSGRSLPAIGHTLSANSQWLIYIWWYCRWSTSSQV